jgi:hypothetical protein
MQTSNAFANLCANKLEAFLKKSAAVKDKQYSASVKNMKDIPATLAAFNLSSNSYYQL